MLTGVFKWEYTLFTGVFKWEYTLFTGDFQVISVAAVCQIIHRVSRALVSKRRQDVLILFPDPNQLADVKQKLYAISNFANVFGAIDFTHKLYPPVVIR